MIQKEIRKKYILETIYKRNRKIQTLEYFRQPQPAQGGLLVPLKY